MEVLPRFVCHSDLLPFCVGTDSTVRGSLDITECDYMASESVSKDIRDQVAFILLVGERNPLSED